jgi:hypothetical protein
MSDTDTPRLPQSPDLEQERKRAKELRKALGAGDGAAIARLRRHHPGFAQATPDQIHAARCKLSDAQCVIAREYGFPSWPALKARIEDLVRKDEAPPLNLESATALGGIFPRKYERHLKSIGRSFPTSITFRNLSPHNISTFCLDHNGERVAFRTLQSSYSYVQQTHISHPWVVVDSAGRCIGIVLPGSATRTVTIRERSISAGGTEADATEKPVTLYCSFCGRSQHEVKKLVAGPNAFICDKCVDLCETVIEAPDGVTLAQEPVDADPVPTELLLNRLKLQNKVFDYLRTDLGNTVNRLRKRDVSWDAMGEALGVPPQVAQERFS